MRRDSDPLVGSSRELLFASSSEWIWAKLESNGARAIGSTAFEMKHRPGAVGGPQSAGLPIRISSIDAAIDVLREEAHRIRNGEVDEGAVYECEYRAVEITHHDRYVGAQAKGIEPVHPDIRYLPRLSDATARRC